MFNKSEILNSLYSGIVDVLFQKADGSLRLMKCTLDPNIVPPTAFPQDKPIDFTMMTESEIIEHCGDSGERWGKAFIAHFPEFDENVISAWFKNAIESGIEARLKKEESSIIKVWEISVGWRSFDLSRVKSLQFANPS